MASLPRSLRFKLTAWFVLVFILIEGLLLGGVAVLSRGLIRQTLDESLTATAEQMIESIIAAEVDLTPEEVHALIPASAEFAFWAIRDDSGAVLVTWNVDDQEALPFSDWELVPAGPIGDVVTPIAPEQAERLIGRASPLRLLTLHFRYRERLHLFQVAEHSGFLDRLLGPYFNLVVVGVPVGVLVAMIAAWLIAGRAVAPIRRLQKAAESVSPESFGARIDVATTDPEISRLETELNFALERLEAGYEAYGHFISNVSHELKTPIAILLTEAQVAKIGDRPLERSHEFIDKVEREMKRLGDLVENILTLARADLQSEQKATLVSMNDVVLEAVSASQELAKDAQVHLIPMLHEAKDSDDDPLVLGEQGLLRTVADNLIRNAITHSPVEGKVEIEVRRRGREILLLVSDRGPGLEDEFKELVFERFVQGPGARERGGSGLGLSIASRIVRLHEGRIRVLDRDGGGSVFEVTLPLAPHHARAGSGANGSFPSRAPRAPKD